MTPAHRAAGAAFVAFLALGIGSWTAVAQHGHAGAPGGTTASPVRTSAAQPRLQVGDLSYTTPLGLACIDVGAIGCRASLVAVSTGGPVSAQQVSVSGDNSPASPATTGDVAVANGGDADVQTVAVSLQGNANACGGAVTVAVAVSGSAASCAGGAPVPGVAAGPVSVQGGP